MGKNVVGRVSKLVAGLVAVAMVLAIAGCSSRSGGGQAGTKSGEKVIKIGAAVSMSGSLSNEGKLVKDAYDLWQSYVNDNGGIEVGGQKYKVNIIFYDDKSDAQTSAKLTEKLITEDGAKFILGPFSSGITQATSRIGEKYGVVTMASLANADSLYEAGLKYLFSPLARNSTKLNGAIDMLSTLNPKPQTVGIVTPDDLAPLAMANGAKKYAESKGLNIVYFGKFPKGAQDISSIVTELKQKNPDVIFETGYLEDSLLVVRALKDLRVSPKLLVFPTAPVYPGFIKSLKADAEYVTVAQWWTPQMKWKDPVFGANENFVKLFRDRLKYEPTDQNAAAAATAVVLEVALQKAGTVDDAAKVQAALRNLDVETLLGRVKFDEKNMNSFGRAGVSQVQDGKITMIYPKQEGAQPIRYPTPAWDKR